MHRKIIFAIVLFCLVLLVKPDVFAFLGSANSKAEDLIDEPEAKSTVDRSDFAEAEKLAESNEVAEVQRTAEQAEEARKVREIDKKINAKAEDEKDAEEEQEEDSEEIKEDNPYAELIGKSNISANYADEAAYNVQLAVDYHQNVVIPAGGTYNAFSVLGDGGEDKGFKPARGLLSDGTIELLYGSGICPVTTAVFQAGRDAGLTILEAHDHVGAESSYAGAGDQAMFNYPTSNLRMRNDFDYPVSLYISYSGTSIYAEWYLEKTGEEEQDNQL